MRQTSLGLLARLFLVVVLAGLTAGPEHKAQASGSSQAQFDPLPILTVGAADGSTHWGDYINDENDRLDALVTGISNEEKPRTILFKNGSSGASITLDEISTAIKNVEAGSAVWGDYDRDGYLDVLVTGMTGLTVTGGKTSVQAHTAIYRNTDNSPNQLQPRVFQNILADLPALYRGKGVWGDFDNDGALDVLLTGYLPASIFTNPPTPFTQIYRNAGGNTFTSMGLSLPAAGDSDAALADFNRDGWLDIALIGMSAAGPVATVYQNNANLTFSPIDLNLPGMFDGVVEWVDVNADGWPDLFLSGNAGSDTGENRLPMTRLYLNHAGQFALVDPDLSGLPNLWNTSVDWADFDNDGDPDLLINGQSLLQTFTRLYINELKTSGEFVDAQAGLAESADSSVSWSDIDRNGALDIFVTGVRYEENGVEYYASHPYRSTLAAARRNTPPAAPTGLAACWDGGSQVTFWASPPTDDFTPQAALSYNLRLGSSAGGGDLVMPPANLLSGFHRLGGPGRWYGPAKITGLQPGIPYFWSLHAVDGAQAGGPFAPERSFLLGNKITQDDSAETDEDQPISIPVLNNDQSSNGAVTLLFVEKPARGTAVVQSGQVQYTPAKDDFGQDTFTYYAVDESGYCTGGSVTVTIHPEDNDPPDDILLSNATVAENQPPGAVVGTLSAHDPDTSSSVTLSLPAGAADNNSFVLDGLVLKTAQTFDRELQKIYTVRVRAVDNTGLAFEKDLAIEITDEIDFPPALAWVDAQGTLHPAYLVTVWMSVDATPLPFRLSLAAGDPDVDDALTWSIPAANQPQHGTAAVSGKTIDRQPKAVQYTPAPGYLGEDQFVVQVTDRAGLTGTITVRVLVVNLRPMYLPLISR